MKGCLFTLEIIGTSDSHFELSLPFVIRQVSKFPHRWCASFGAVFRVDFYINSFLLVLSIFKEYNQNFYLHRLQNIWINLFEMREKDALSGQMSSRYSGIFFKRREKTKKSVVVLTCWNGH